METSCLATTTNSTRSSSAIPRENVNLSDIEETLLVGVWWRSIDAQAANPILGDKHASLVMERCLFDMSKAFFVNDQRWVRYICNRARTFDKWCQQWLDNHVYEPVQVIHLGCGLDSRNLRVRWTDRNVRWYDIDLPVVCDLRRRLMPLPPTKPGGKSEYSLRSLSVTDEGWYRDIPSDRLTMLVCEGLIFFFSPSKVEKLFHDVVEYFGGGQFVFDTVGSLAVKYRTAPFKNTTLCAKWGVDDARQIEKFHPKLKMTGRIRWEDYLGNEASLGQSAPPLFGTWTQAMLALKSTAAFKDALQVLRFEFGDRAKSAASSKLVSFSTPSILDYSVDSTSETTKED